MLLRYKNLTIRNAGIEDAGQLAAWWNNGKVMAHAGFPNGTGQTKEEIAEGLKGDTDETRRRLIIEIDGKPAGEMVYCNMGERVAEIGVKICDFSQQDKGQGKILLSMLISALFDDMGYEKIVLDTNFKNTRAQHVYERLGFQRLRVRERSWQDQLGEWQDTVEYELFPENFVNFAR